VALSFVVFDVGETLVDETAMWERAADSAGVPRFTLMGVLGGLAARGEQHTRVWEILGVEVDFIANSTVWGIEKPEPAFFDRVAETCGCAPEEIAYVGDRVDNDVVPARAAGMLAVHLRRGPWGYLHDAPAGTPTIDSLAELPGVLERA
jgi:FMN phosphatase YigB (HAD superfamily)